MTTWPWPYDRHQHHPQSSANHSHAARQIADSVRLRMAFSREVACAQNMRF
jgi:hypothetical protein